MSRRIWYVVVPVVIIVALAGVAVVSFFDREEVERVSLSDPDEAGSDLAAPGNDATTDTTDADEPEPEAEADDTDTDTDDTEIDAGDDADDTGDDTEADTDGLDGEWVLTDDGTSLFGYRVTEVLNDSPQPVQVVGRSESVQGRAVVTGGQLTEADVTGDLRDLTSDSGNRDRAIRQTGLESDTFPDAVFTLTEPLDLADLEPGTVTPTALAGTLTVREVTQDVTVDAEVRIGDGRVEVAGVIQTALSDFDIEPPILGPVVSIEDAAEIEVLLAWIPADV